MSDKRAWGEEFNSLKDFIDLLSTPNNASGMFGRTAAATILELEAELDALKEKLDSTSNEIVECFPEGTFFSQSFVFNGRKVEADGDEAFYSKKKIDSAIDSLNKVLNSLDN